MPTWYASEAAVAAASRRAFGTLEPSLCITTALAMAPITDRQLAPTRKFDTRVRTKNLVSCSLQALTTVMAGAAQGGVGVGVQEAGRMDKARHQSQTIRPSTLCPYVIRIVWL